MRTHEDIISTLSDQQLIVFLYIYKWLKNTAAFTE